MFRTMFRDFEIAALLLLCMILLYLMLAVDTLDRRLTPRIVYVHSSNEPKIIEPEADRAMGS